MEKLLTMKEAKEFLGVSTKTIQNWDRDGKIKIVRTPGGRRRIPLSEVERVLGIATVGGIQRKIAIYARVSSNEQKQKGDLERQITYIKEGISPSFIVVNSITDVGSGLNDHRKGLMKLMQMARDGEITDIAILYKDRITRFGYNYLEEYFKSHGVTIHVIGTTDFTKSVQEELAEDLISIIASFSGKLYGLRSKKKKKLKQAVEEAMADASDIPNKVKRPTHRSPER